MAKTDTVNLPDDRMVIGGFALPLAMLAERCALQPVEFTGRKDSPVTMRTDKVSALVVGANGQPYNVTVTLSIWRDPINDAESLECINARENSKKRSADRKAADDAERRRIVEAVKADTLNTYRAGAKDQAEMIGQLRSLTSELKNIGAV